MVKAVRQYTLILTYSRLNPAILKVTTTTLAKVHSTKTIK